MDTPEVDDEDEEESAMLQQLISKVFDGGRQPLVYRTTINGKRLATQWTRYAGPSDLAGPDGTPLHRFEFLLELDPTAVGQGGGVLRQRCRLTCDSAYRPVRYISQAKGSAVLLQFKDDQVAASLGDGSTHTVPLGGAQSVMESNIIGQHAILLALAHAAGKLEKTARFTAFVVNGLLAVPYQLDRAPDLDAEGGTGYRSSYEEELRLDARGIMVLSRSPTQAMETVLLGADAPALPTWTDAEIMQVDRPVYVAPKSDKFRLEDVDIPGKVTALGATVSLPNLPGRQPAVLFLSGSGTHDRNGIAGEIDIGTHEVMDHLAEQGFVGLRYDTRGAGSTKLGEDMLDAGFASVVEDARSALDYLRSRPEVDPARLFVIGHSQGGSAALHLAGAGGEAFAGVVLMATIGRPLDQIVEDQILTFGKQQGMTEEVITRQVQELRDFVKRARSHEPWEPGSVPDRLYLATRSRKWIVEHLELDNAVLIQRVACPLLIIQGEADFQVSAEKDARALDAAARAAGRQVTLTLLPGLDHCMKRADGESKLEQYYDRSRRVDPSFLSALRGWLATQAAAAQPLGKG